MVFRSVSPAILFPRGRLGLFALLGLFGRHLL
jgi:hypothetical protein